MKSIRISSTLFYNTFKYPLVRSAFFSSSAYQTIEMIYQGSLKKVDAAEYCKKFSSYSSIHFDLGAGDGKFAYTRAKESPHSLYVAFDTNPDAMGHMAWKSSRKPHKGGINNVDFIVSSVQKIPDAFSNTADFITINYPWANLLEGVLLPKPEILEKIASIGKNNTTLTLLLNYSIFKDKKLITKLGLPHVDATYIDTKLRNFYLNYSIKLSKFKFTKDLVHHTTWGKKLVLGSGQKITLSMQCKIIK